jgi:hypothetical protein
LFVKLRQYAGAGRQHVALRTRELEWTPNGCPGVERKILYESPQFPDAMRLERWAPHTTRSVPDRAQGAEIFVLDGTLEGEAGSLDARAWLRVPVGDALELTARERCTLYLKTGGIAALRSLPG